MEMNDIHLHSENRRWLPKHWMLRAISGIVVCGLCIILVLYYFAYRHVRMEQEVVADFLSRSPGGTALVDNRPSLFNSLYDTLGISKPVTDLFLKGTQIKDSDLNSLESLKFLTSLSVDQCPITDEGVKKIVKVRTLESLSLFGCEGITDASLTYLGTLVSLTSLHITAASDRVSASNIQCLEALPNLEILDLSQCCGISDNAVEQLASLKHLINLDICGTSISEEGAKRLCRVLTKTIVLTDYFDSKLVNEEKLVPDESLHQGGQIER
jgi:hypothetical protein